MHTLQPKHTKVKKEEVEKILKKFNIALAQLPKISKKDAVIAEGFETGDVVQIERKGELAEIYYRVVI
jgi:DNA-directed RNA polymerase subunit H (RpoH/RPB5)